MSEYLINNNNQLYLSPKGAEFLIDWAKMTLEFWQLQGQPDDDVPSDVAALIMVLAPAFVEAYDLDVNILG